MLYKDPTYINNIEIFDSPYIEFIQPSKDLFFTSSAGLGKHVTQAHNSTFLWADV